VTVKVKICGLKTQDALDAAVDAGADYAGLVFFAKSPRNVSLETAASLAGRARQRSRAKIVALLVDADDALIDAIARTVRPDILQLHGSESGARVSDIAKRTGLTIWKAVPVATNAEVETASKYCGPGKAAMILFDAKPPADPNALPGGNGLTFDWRILRGHREPFVLAGGLTPDNIADAVRLVSPAVVDVSSGVEERPGEKSTDLIRRFIRAAKG
jgi:phosphoribosylanthranilate isomerase